MEKPNQVWCTDFTYLFLKDGTNRYNCTIIDLYDRSVVASLNRSHITAELAIETLKIAISHYNPGKGISSFTVTKEINSHPKNLTISVKNHFFSKV